MLLETSNNEEFDVLYAPNFYEVLGDSPDTIGLLTKKEVNDIKGFFSGNIFIIKQSLLLTFLRLLRIAQN